MGNRMEREEGNGLGEPAGSSEAQYKRGDLLFEKRGSQLGEFFRGLERELGEIRRIFGEGQKLGAFLSIVGLFGESEKGSNRRFSDIKKAFGVFRK